MDFWRLKFEEPMNLRKRGKMADKEKSYKQEKSGNNNMLPVIGMGRRMITFLKKYF